MASLAVSFLSGIERNTALDTISRLLDAAPQQKLAYVPWTNFPYHPEVHFAIAYGVDAMFLKYHVREKHIRAVNNTPQSPVYQDSCVEFFISFDNDPAYYNFEFNCIGANLSGYGAGRADRKMVPVEATKHILYATQISNDHNSDLISWQLTLAIPFTAFHYHTITSLQGQHEYISM